MELANIYQGALMEHNAYPDYKYQMDDATCSHEGVNPSCGDDITLSLRVVDGVIEEAAFEGSGCAISQASTDIMADLVTDRTLEDAKRMVDNFHKLIRGEEIDEAAREELGEAIELEGISLMPARVKCALLGWRTLDQMLAEQAE